jgi:hypothetical protein
VPKLCRDLRKIYILGVQKCGERVTKSVHCDIRCYLPDQRREDRRTERITKCVLYKEVAVIPFLCVVLFDKDIYVLGKARRKGKSSVRPRCLGRLDVLLPFNDVSGLVDADLSERDADIFLFEAQHFTSSETAHQTQLVSNADISALFIQGDDELLQLLR